jgi:hypothetical protein
MAGKSFDDGGTGVPARMTAAAAATAAGWNTGAAAPVGGAGASAAMAHTLRQAWMKLCVCASGVYGCKIEDDEWMGVAGGGHMSAEEQEAARARRGGSSGNARVMTSGPAAVVRGLGGCKGFRGL